MRRSSETIRTGRQEHRQAAVKETVNSEAREAHAMAGCVGDKEKVDRLRSYFREGCYSDVVKVTQKLRYPRQRLRARAVYS